MQMAAGFALWICLSIFRVVTSQASSTGTFTNPPEIQNLTSNPSNNVYYSIGSDINITWTTNASAVSLGIWQFSDDSLTSNIGDIQYLPGSRKLTGLIRQKKLRRYREPDHTLLFLDHQHQRNRAKLQLDLWTDLSPEPLCSAIR